MASDLNQAYLSSEAEVSRFVEKLVGMDLPCDERPFRLGDVSFHMGWTFHRAGFNSTDRPRRVMTIIYMDMRLSEPDSDARRFDRSVWCKGVEVGEVIAGPDNPLIYQVNA